MNKIEFCVIAVNKNMNKREIGTRYEKAAAYYLEQQGYEILEYNYRCRIGEIDLIARDRGCLVFCEVKYRKSQGVENPLEAVDVRKQKTIWKVAQQYLITHQLLDVPCRFDVIGVEGNKVMLIKNAFEG